MRTLTLHSIGSAIGLALGLLVAGCGSSTSTTAPNDMSMVTTGDQAAVSCCGMPGDTGNSLGVGKYCQTDDDCKNNTMAKTCAAPLAPGINICTIPLCQQDAGSSACGENAVCYFSPVFQNTGCAPTSCLPIKQGCNF